jgi:hypothetical protein
MEKMPFDRKTYMREYKAKKYAENPDYERAYNTAMRVKRLNNFTTEDFKRFGLNLPKVCRLQRALNDLPPDVAKVVYLEYIKDKE